MTQKERTSPIIFRWQTAKVLMSSERQRHRELIQRRNAKHKVSLFVPIKQKKLPRAQTKLVAHIRLETREDRI